MLFVLSFFLLVGVFVFTLYPRIKTSSYPTPSEGKLNIVTTTYPLFDFTRNVGGEFVSVTNATPPGVEPHDFEPTPREVAFMETADVFIMNGGGMDAWADDVATAVKNRGGVVVNMEDVVEFSAGDPHIWLDPVRAQDMVKAIRRGLGLADEAHRDMYEAQAFSYTEKLKELDSEYAMAFKSCKLHDIIVAHDAFSYLGERYTINIHHILGISPDVEPSAKDLSSLVETAKSLGITTVFFETLLSPKLSQTIADDIGGTTAILNPIEGLTDEQIAAGEDYLSLMKENLTALKQALVCQ